MLSDAITEEIQQQGDKYSWRGSHRRPVFGWPRHVLLSTVCGGMALGVAAFPFAASMLDDVVVQGAGVAPAFITPDECSYLPCNDTEPLADPEPWPVPLIRKAEPGASAVAVAVPTQLLTGANVTGVPVPVYTMVPVKPKPDPVPTVDPVIPVESPVEEQPPVEQPPPVLNPPPTEDTDCDGNTLPPQAHRGNGKKRGHSTKEYREEPDAGVENSEEPAEESDEHQSQGEATPPVASGEGTEAPAAS